MTVVNLLTETGLPPGTNLWRPAEALPRPFPSNSESERSSNRTVVLRVSRAP